MCSKNTLTTDSYQTNTEKKPRENKMCNIPNTVLYIEKEVKKKTKKKRKYQPIIRKSQNVI